MANVKMSSKVDEEVWAEVRKHSEESGRTISGILTEALRDYLKRGRVRPQVLRHLEDSMAEHDELGRRLAE